MKRVIVCDLDGTLTNPEHRLHFINCDKPDFDSFYGAVSDDTPNEWCVRLIQAMAMGGHEIHFVTARREKCRLATCIWIRQNLGPNFDYVLHIVRPNYDNYPDDEIKIAWLRKFGSERILFWVDDRQRVVDAIRKEGITVLQCAKWREYQRRDFRVGGTI